MKTTSYSNTFVINAGLSHIGINPLVYTHPSLPGSPIRLTRLMEVRLRSHLIRDLNVLFRILRYHRYHLPSIDRRTLICKCVVSSGLIPMVLFH